MAALLALAIQELPAIIATIKALHDQQSPGNVITDEEVLAALTQAIASSLAKDDQWLAAHPDLPEEHH